MKTCVFVGPSALNAPHYPGVVRFSPAAQGSIFLAVEEGFQRIGLIDGFFGNVPSVWHKEILYALSLGAEVIGASSMGALRAAELHSHGMLGLGVIFRYYKSGALTDDDEVCVLHAVKELGYHPLSLSMVSVRKTIKRLVNSNLMCPDHARSVIREIKATHFSERTHERVLAAIQNVMQNNFSNDVDSVFQAVYRDIKNERV